MFRRGARRLSSSQQEKGGRTAPRTERRGESRGTPSAPSTFDHALTLAVAVDVVLALDGTVGLSLAQQLAIGVALGALVPRALFGYGRSLWLVMNYLVAMAEQRHEWECPRQR
jgi:hypothetical protein